MQMIQLGDFVLNKELSTIIINNEEVAIEPKLLELLLLFCDNANRIISRQEILEEIWQGSVVTDNAINKMIANFLDLVGQLFYLGICVCLILKLFIFVSRKMSKRYL